MKVQSRRHNVAEARLRAREATEATQALVAAGLFRDAMSRAYCAALHHARAMLFARGLEARTPDGAFLMLHREFGKAGHLPNVPSWQLAGLLRSRELAEYDPTAQFTAADLRGQLALLGHLAGDAAALLQREGIAG